MDFRARHDPTVVIPSLRVAARGLLGLVMVMAGCGNGEPLPAGDGGKTDATCAPIPCPSAARWDPERCRCQAFDAPGRPDAAACRGAGRYEAGKEGSYRPCCPGFNEVPYPSPAYSGGEKVCWMPPLNVYACVRGTCGDGICEVGEAPACGCAADCPSARWGAPPDGSMRADAQPDR
jgi:hypothetical protein